jgi:hypothetical protein
MSTVEGGFIRDMFLLSPQLLISTGSSLRSRFARQLEFASPWEVLHIIL